VNIGIVGLGLMGAIRVADQLLARGNCGGLPNKPRAIGNATPLLAGNARSIDLQASFLRVARNTSKAHRSGTLSGHRRGVFHRCRSERIPRLLLNLLEEPDEPGLFKMMVGCQGCRD
jgi:hypothetical protein